MKNDSHDKQNRLEDAAEKERIQANTKKALRKAFGYSESPLKDEEGKPIPKIDLGALKNPDILKVAVSHLDHLIYLEEWKKTDGAGPVELAKLVRSAMEDGATRRDYQRLRDRLQPPAFGRIMDDATAAERKWLIPPPDDERLAAPTLPANCVSVLAGEPGGGKTTAALQIGAALAFGIKGPYFRKEKRLERTKPISVLYAGWDVDRDEVSCRLQSIKRELQWFIRRGLTPDFWHTDLTELGPMWGYDRNINEPAELLQNGRWLLSIAAETEARLLIIDPSAAACVTNPNDRGAARRFVNYMNAWGKRNQCATLLVADTGDSYSDWFGAVRSLWHLGEKIEVVPSEFSNRDAAQYALEHGKSMRQTASPAIYLRRTEDGVWLESKA